MYVGSAEVAVAAILIAADAAKEFSKQIKEPLEAILNGEPLLQPGVSRDQSNVTPGEAFAALLDWAQL